MPVQYRYGRVSTKYYPDGTVKSYITGPTTEFSKYRGARQAPLRAVRRAAILAKPAEDIVVSVYGQLYVGKEQFEWKAAVFDREQFIRDLDVQMGLVKTIEDVTQSLFGWNQTPALILAWDIRPIKS